MTTCHGKVCTVIDIVSAAHVNRVILIDLTSWDKPLKIQAVGFHVFQILLEVIAVKKVFYIGPFNVIFGLSISCYVKGTVSEAINDTVKVIYNAVKDCLEVTS